MYKKSFFSIFLFFFNKSFKHNFIEVCISFVIIIDSFIYSFIF